MTKKYYKYTDHNHSPVINQPSIFQSNNLELSLLAWPSDHPHPPCRKVTRNLSNSPSQSCKEMRRNSKAPGGKAVSRRARKRTMAPVTPWNYPLGSTRAHGYKDHKLLPTGQREENIWGQITLSQASSREASERQKRTHLNSTWLSHTTPQNRLVPRGSQ